MSPQGINIKKAPFSKDHVNKLILAKNLDSAEKLIRKELKKKPRDFTPLFLMGFLLSRKKNYDGAKVYLKRALVNTSQTGEKLEAALVLTGVHLSSDERELAIKVAEAHLGDYASEHLAAKHLTARLVDLCIKAKDWDRLRKIQEKLLLRKDESFDALKTVCMNYQALGEMDKAVELAVSGVEKYPEAAVLAANLYNDLGEFDKSEYFLQKGLERAPDNAVLIVMLANVHSYQGKNDKAKALLEGSGNTDNPHLIKSTLGTLYLKQGDFKQGHALMESRYDNLAYESKANLLERVNFKLPLPESANIFISQEEGVGDQIRFAKYLSMLDMDMAERVNINCNDRLIPLFKESFPDLNFIAVKDINLEYMQKHQITRQILLGSTYFLADKPMILAEKGYLKTGNIAEARDPAKPIKIGLCWRSIKLLAARVRWYMPLQEVAALFADIDCELVSLQNDVTEQELETIREYSGKELQVSDVDAKDDFLGLARLIGELDLVISAATATCELAGATGQETWVLGNAHPNRWYLSQQYQDHFYPKIKLYLNKGSADWSELAAEVRQDLLAFVSKSQY